MNLGWNETQEDRICAKRMKIVLSAPCSGRTRPSDAGTRQGPSNNISVSVKLRVGLWNCWNNMTTRMWIKAFCVTQTFPRRRWLKDCFQKWETLRYSLTVLPKMGDIDVDLWFSTGWQQVRFFLYLWNYRCKTINSLVESGPSIFWASADTRIGSAFSVTGWLHTKWPYLGSILTFCSPWPFRPDLSPHRVSVDSISLLFQTRGLINRYLNNKNPIFMHYLKLRWNCGFEN